MQNAKGIFDFVVNISIFIIFGTITSMNEQQEQG